MGQSSTVDFYRELNITREEVHRSVLLITIMNRLVQFERIKGRKPLLNTSWTNEEFWIEPLTPNIANVNIQSLSKDTDKGTRYGSARPAGVSLSRETLWDQFGGRQESISGTEVRLRPPSLPQSRGRLVPYLLSLVSHLFSRIGGNGRRRIIDLADLSPRVVYHIR